VTVPTPWNVNIHYDGTLDAFVPSTARSVLDVGCGDGFLAARLARRISRVVALDLDQSVLGRAQARIPEAPVTWLHGDALANVVLPRSFDAVVSKAALHHLPNTRTGLRRLSTLVRPGGALAIVTFARTDWRKLASASAAFIARAVANRAHGKWEHSAPTVWTPADTFRQLRASGFHLAAHHRTNQHDCFQQRNRGPRLHGAALIERRPAQGDASLVRRRVTGQGSVYRDGRARPGQCCIQLSASC
jgi:2-polyprenyl-3-methyl-5-hydroxy-6-metoxy-1,4-benzoquinol methylase